MSGGQRSPQKLHPSAPASPTVPQLLLLPEGGMKQTASKLLKQGTVNSLYTVLPAPEPAQPMAVWTHPQGLCLNYVVPKRLRNPAACSTKGLFSKMLTGLV